MTRARLLLLLGLIVVLSTGSIGVMYFLAQRAVVLGGGFSRHFLSNQVLVAEDTLMLGYDSYYLAGVSRGSIYLGNKVGLRHILRYDVGMRDTQHLLLRVLNRDSIMLGALQVRVDSPIFYLYDGSVPIVFKSNSRAPLVTSVYKSESYFVHGVPRDSSTLFVYGFDSKRHGRLGLLHVGSGNAMFRAELLDSAGDGVFSVDGMMHYDATARRLVYLYHYRNEFVVADSLLQEVGRGHTIDTNRVARIVVATKSDGTLVTQGLPTVVNMHSTVSSGYMYVHSKVKSDEEESSHFRVHEVIDVYDYEERGYVGSFYLPARWRDELRAIAVVKQMLFALYKDEVVIYSLSPLRFK